MLKLYNNSEIKLNYNFDSLFETPLVLNESEYPLSVQESIDRIKEEYSDLELEFKVLKFEDNTIRLICNNKLQSIYFGGDPQDA